MIVAPRFCWHAWLWQARESDLSCRPRQAIHPVTFDCSPPPKAGRALCSRRHNERRNFPVHYCRVSTSIWIEPT
jgi:hypothetical protein